MGKCKNQYRNPKAQRGILLPAAISMSSTARAALPLSFYNITDVYSNKQILLKNVESIKQDWSCAAVILRLASIFTKKILRLVQLYAIIAFITLIGCGGRHQQEEKTSGWGWQYSLDKQHGLLLAAISKRNNLMTEEEWDNHDTSQENADVIIDIGMCGKEKAAEKTVNCGVFEGESLLLRIFYTKNFVIQNKHITFVA